MKSQLLYIIEHFSLECDAHAIKVVQNTASIIPTLISLYSFFFHLLTPYVSFLSFLSIIPTLIYPIFFFFFFITPFVSLMYFLSNCAILNIFSFPPCSGFGTAFDWPLTHL